MKKGFTLLELLIVIIILGILAAIAMPRYFANIQKAREAEARATLNAIREAELAYFAQNGVFVAVFPISANLSGGASPDIYLVQPQSSSFTYTIPNIVAGSAYVRAARINPPNPDSYCMMIEGGFFKTCAAAATCACP